MKHRIAVLGLHHDHVWSNVEELLRTDRAELVAAADPYPELRDRHAAELPGRLYEDPAELLDQEKDLDAVYVFASNRLSEDLVVAACERGLPCLVEKPMASTFSGAERMKQAADEAGVRLMVNWPFAWWPQLRHALDLAREGDIGQVWQVRYRSAHQGPKELGCSGPFCEWLYDEERNGGGALMDYGCYGALLAQVLLGRPQQVHGTRIRTGLKPDLDLEDNAVLLCQYPEALAIAEASWTQQDTRTAYTTTIYGSKGTLEVEPDRSGRLFRADLGTPEGVEMDVPASAPHLETASLHFLAALEDPELELHPLCDPGMALGAQWILERGKEACATGAAIPEGT